jgi:hypothetical protein
MASHFARIRIFRAAAVIDSIYFTALTDRKFDSRRAGVRGLGGEGFTHSVAKAHDIELPTIQQIGGWRIKWSFFARSIARMPVKVKRAKLVMHFTLAVDDLAVGVCLSQE